MKLYITPNEYGKFSYNLYKGFKPDDPSAIEATQKMIDGLDNHTLCWDDGKLVEYKKTREDLTVEARQKIQDEIGRIKSLLSGTDYKAIKYAEGELSEEDFSPIREQRREWRNQINELEKLLIE